MYQRFFRDVNSDSVSMKSGLEDRNNAYLYYIPGLRFVVSMKSGLEDRNNLPANASPEAVEKSSQ